MGRGGPELRVDAQLIAALPKREARPNGRHPMGENDGQTNPERFLLGFLLGWACKNDVL